MQTPWTVTIHADVTITPPHSFTPRDIPGLQLWLKADAGVYQDAALTIPAVLDGAPIGGWIDQGPGGNNVLQASAPAQPALKVAGINGLPVVHPNGTSDVLATAAPIAHGIGTGDFYLAALIRVGAADNADRAIWANGVYAPGWYVETARPALYFSTTYFDLPTLAAGSVHLLEVWRAAGVLYFGLDGITSTQTYSFVGSIANAVNRIFNDTDGSDFGDHDLGELVFAAGGGGLANQAALRSYMLGRWGVG